MVDWKGGKEVGFEIGNGELDEEETGNTLRYSVPLCLIFLDSCMGILMLSLPQVLPPHSVSRYHVAPYGFLQALDPSC